MKKRLMEYKYFLLLMIYSKPPLELPAGWIVRRNAFYDIDPFGDEPVEDKETLIFLQEDMLWITKDDYNMVEI